MFEQTTLDACWILPDQRDGSHGADGNWMTRRMQEPQAAAGNVAAPGLITIDRTSPVPLYFQVAQHFEAAIRSGALKVGSRLDNEVQLAERLGLSRPTVRAAFQYLSNKGRSEEHTSELQSPVHLVCRLLLEKKKLRCGAMNMGSGLFEAALGQQSRTDRKAPFRSLWLRLRRDHSPCRCTSVRAGCRRRGYSR